MLCKLFEFDNDSITRYICTNVSCIVKLLMSHWKLLYVFIIISDRKILINEFYYSIIFLHFVHSECLEQIIVNEHH